MSKPGSGGVTGTDAANVARRERLRALALETADVTNDPYMMKNHLGAYECRLCLTQHNNEGNYLAHTHGRKHQTNLAKRQQRRADAGALTVPAHRHSHSLPAPLSTPRSSVGLPQYRVLKQYDRTSHRFSLLFSVDYPLIVEGMQPRHRVMSAFEQRVESRDPRIQYLLLAAAPYCVLAFRLPNWPIETDPQRFVTHWDADTKMFLLQLEFKREITATVIERP